MKEGKLNPTHHSVRGWGEVTIFNRVFKVGPVWEDDINSRT